jgi:hypothetical protein
MRDSSTQRAIIALSVVSRNDSMAAVLLLHAVNPGLAAVGRFRGRCKLQSGNIIPFCNSQHKYSRVSLHGFANGARPGPPAGQESSKNTGRSARVTIEIAVFFPGLPRVAAWSVPQAMGRPATLSIMQFGKRPPSIGRRDRAPGGSDLVGPTCRPGLGPVDGTGRESHMAAHVDLPIESGLRPQKGWPWPRQWRRWRLNMVNLVDLGPFCARAAPPDQ